MQLHTPAFRRAFSVFGAALVFLATTALAATSRQNYDLKAAPAETALKEFSAQSGQQVIFPTDLVRNVRTRPIKGDYTPQEALDHMLADTNLVAVKDEKTGAFAVRKETETEAKNDQRVATNSRHPSEMTDDATESGVIKLETFEVMGSKLLNMDIPRTRDDPQPYVIFDRAKIERSGAVNIEDFMKNYLTQNSVGATKGQFGGTPVSTSSINLRGLGANQTLILIDGRRAPAIMSPFNDLQQPDLNGIPLAAVERVEVLPATASGIYGGGATGGVINIILRRDYRGVETKLRYENSFESDSAVERADIAIGLNSKDGRTSLLVAASSTREHSLAAQDRGFIQRYVYRVLANNGNNYQFFNSGAAIFGQGGAGPALGATTNIRSSDGTPLTLKSGTPLNSAITFVPFGYSGTGSDAGAALVANAGKYNLQLGPSTLSSNSPLGGESGLLSETRVDALGITIRHKVTRYVQLFCDAGVSNNKGAFPFSQAGLISYTIPASAPTNPFDKSIDVRFPIPNDLALSSTTHSSRLATGAVIKLPANWMSEIDYTWSESHSSFISPGTEPFGPLSAAIANGTVNVMRDVNLFPVDVASFGPYATQYTLVPPRDTLRDATIRISGPALETSAGAVAVSGFAEHRSESISDSSYQQSATVTRVLPSRSQTVSSFYSEVHVPFKLGTQQFDFQVAARRDAYITRGVTGVLRNPTPATPIVRATNRFDSVDPTFAIRYTPADFLTFRASYGTGFLPATVQQIAPSSAGLSASVLDPRRGNQTTVLRGDLNQYITDGNPDLRPEESHSWSAGTVFSIKKLGGLRVSLDYVRIAKHDNISSFPGGNQALINNEALFPDRIVRGPKLASDPPDWAGPISFLNATLLNIARSVDEAVDLQFDYDIQTTSFGKFSAFAVATRHLHHKTQLLEGQPFVENVGVGDGGSPLGFRSTFGTTWNYHSWTVGWTGRYFGPYWLNAAHSYVISQGSSSVAGQLYHDIFISYQFSGSAGSMLGGRIFQGCEISFGAKDIFNHSPPFDFNNQGNGYYSRWGDPRMASYFISIKKNF